MENRTDTIYNVSGCREKPYGAVWIEHEIDENGNTSLIRLDLGCSIVKVMLEERKGPWPCTTTK